MDKPNRLSGARVEKPPYDKKYANKTPTDDKHEVISKVEMFQNHDEKSYVKSLNDSKNSFRRASQTRSERM